MHSIETFFFVEVIGRGLIMTMIAVGRFPTALSLGRLDHALEPEITGRGHVPANSLPTSSGGCSLPCPGSAAASGG